MLYRSELGFFLKQEKEEYIFVFVVIFYVFEKGVFLDYYVFSFSLKNQEEYIKNYIQSILLSWTFLLYYYRLSEKNINFGSV